MSTGEEPLSSFTSNEGVYTRTLEINLKPFDDEQQARQCYQLIQKNYGWAGREWIKAIQQDKNTLLQIRNISQKLFDMVLNQYPKTIQSHAQALALVGAVDITTSKLIFGEKNPEEETIITLEAVAEQLQGTEEVDIGLRAYEYVVDMVNAHVKNFEEEAKERWGFLQDGTVEFFPTVLEKLLREMNFNPKKVFASWEEKGLIKIGFEKDKKRYSIVKRKGNTLYRVVEIKLPKQEEKEMSLL
ncbi:hypothetical protein [Caldicellulosiruptor acetigenus]|uniref:hypothetical protein n=1 Tax=Caldicellulosiruptor acetigenus TaxID=301953 RepID=UPI0003103DCB|nr:hypothetical protein [Caldicellulosiruptor acetigenus]